jgi:hypothetical protein
MARARSRSAKTPAREHRRRAALPWVFGGVLAAGAAFFFGWRAGGADLSYAVGAVAGIALSTIFAAVFCYEAALAAAFAFTLFWSGAATVGGGDNPYWMFLPVWGALLAFTFRRAWLLPLYAAWTTLLLWTALLFVPQTFLGRAWLAGEHAALLQVLIFVWIAIYILGRGMWWYRRWKIFFASTVTAGAVGAVAALFASTFAAIQGLAASRPQEVAPLWWLVATSACLLSIALLMIWRYRNTRLSTLPFYRQGAFIWLIVAGLLALANVYMAGGHPWVVAAGYNLLSLAGVFWLVMTGRDRGEQRLVNLGMLFLAALAVARLVEMATFGAIFWAAGILFVCGALYFERLRRRLVGRIRAAQRSS